MTLDAVLSRIRPTEDGPEISRTLEVLSATLLEELNA